MLWKAELKRILDIWSLQVTASNSEILQGHSNHPIHTLRSLHFQPPQQQHEKLSFVTTVHCALSHTSLFTAAIPQRQEKYKSYHKTKNRTRQNKAKKQQTNK